MDAATYRCPNFIWNKLQKGTLDCGELVSQMLIWTASLICHYNDVIMKAMASAITSLTSVYLTVYSDQRKHQSSASLAFVRGIHRSPVNSPHKGPVTRKLFPFDDVIMQWLKGYFFLPYVQIWAIDEDITSILTSLLTYCLQCNQFRFNHVAIYWVNRMYNGEKS